MMMMIIIIIIIVIKLNTSVCFLTWWLNSENANYRSGTNTQNKTKEQDQIVIII